MLGCNSRSISEIYLEAIAFPSETKLDVGAVHTGFMKEYAGSNSDTVCGYQHEVCRRNVWES